MAKRTTRSTSRKTSSVSSTADAYVTAPDPVADQADDRGTPALDTQAVSIASEPSEDEIRTRAYRRYLERGGAHGYDVDDWVEAERELRSTL